MFDFSAETGLLGLFVASFLAATLLPGGSELVLLGLLERHPATLLPALGVATLGNTLGGMTSYLIGRWLPNPFIATSSVAGASVPNAIVVASAAAPAAKRREATAVAWLRRFGPWPLLLSWLPVIGDALCVAAGWLRLHAGWSCLAIGAGKAARYAALALGWSWITG